MPCQRGMAIMGVPTVLLEWGQDGQGRPVVGTCLLRKGKGREQGKVCQSNPVNPTEGWHRIPVGVMRWVIGACVSRKMRRVFFPSSHWPAKPVSCERTFLKAEWLPGQFKPCPEPWWNVLLADTMTLWQHRWSSCTWYLAVPIAGCSHLKHRLLSWPLCTSDAFLPWFCSPKRKKLWSQQQKREVGFSMQCHWYVFLTTSLCWEELWAIWIQRGSVGYVV